MKSVAGWPGLSRFLTLFQGTPDCRTAFAARLKFDHCIDHSIPSVHYSDSHDLVVDSITFEANSIIS